MVYVTAKYIMPFEGQDLGEFTRGSHDEWFFDTREYRNGTLLDGEPVIPAYSNTPDQGFGNSFYTNLSEFWNHVAATINAWDVDKSDLHFESTSPGNRHSDAFVVLTGEKWMLIEIGGNEEGK